MYASIRLKLFDGITSRLERPKQLELEVPQNWDILNNLS